MSKLQVNDLSPVIDSLALRDQINDLTEDQVKNIVGGDITITIEFEIFGVDVKVTIKLPT
ncbi:MAG: hypothetical protein IM473_01425 [Microcystis sp. M015S2]|jgi:hypothetical protein|uniref:hypothetical protein n=1 Tax=unclassified Microcystis TaxID=2643300 RepID=UPI00258E4E94|nr:MULTISPECIES: hypothetical protein [unclassified Microcystis]MCA2711006.1 hypothetical protein [Microcystis sp. M025S2]MCA2741103.1 hypothetical protein [Microcystis sp. M015S2]MCA2760766.1 hypothetical protein [Microcystis sp. M145S2]